jgi:hypothetical protein
VKTHTLPPSKDCNALSMALNPSAIDGTTIEFSPFSWAVRLPGQIARNQTAKVRASLNPVIKMGVLLGRRAGKKVLATRAC